MEGLGNFKDKFELKNVKSQMTHKINLELKNIVTVAKLGQAKNFINFFQVFLFGSLKKLHKEGPSYLYLWTDKV